MWLNYFPTGVQEQTRMYGNLDLNTGEWAYSSRVSGSRPQTHKAVAVKTPRTTGLAIRPGTTQWPFLAQPSGCPLVVVRQNC